MSFPKWFDRLPKEAQRAALAVTHIEDVTLATVLQAVERTDLSDGWCSERGIDGYLMAFRCGVRRLIPDSLPPAPVVSLADFRKQGLRSTGSVAAKT
jgi:hypothetical protein